MICYSVDSLQLVFQCKSLNNIGGVFFNVKVLVPAMEQVWQYQRPLGTFSIGGTQHSR